MRPGSTGCFAAALGWASAAAAGAPAASVEAAPARGAAWASGARPPPASPASPSLGSSSSPQRRRLSGFPLIASLAHRWPAGPPRRSPRLGSSPGPEPTRLRLPPSSRAVGRRERIARSWRLGSLEEVVGLDGLGFLCLHHLLNRRVAVCSRLLRAPLEGLNLVEVALRIGRRYLRLGLRRLEVLQGRTRLDRCGRAPPPPA